MLSLFPGSLGSQSSYVIPSRSAGRAKNSSAVSLSLYRIGPCILTRTSSSLLIFCGLTLTFSLKVKVTQLCLTLCDPMDCSPPGSSVHEFSRQEYWSRLPCPPPGDHPVPGSNLHLPSCCRQILYPLNHQGSPWSQTNGKLH